MTFDEYQLKAHTTSGIDGVNAIEMSALGLSAESGEVADLVKKHKYHGHVLDEAKLQEKLGNILWHIAEMATTLGLSLEGLAWTNVQSELHLQLRSQHCYFCGAAEGQIHLLGCIHRGIT